MDSSISQVTGATARLVFIFLADYRHLFEYLGRFLLCDLKCEDHVINFQYSKDALLRIYKY